MGKLLSRFGAAAMLAGASLFVIGSPVHASNTPKVVPSDCTNSISEGGGHSAATIHRQRHGGVPANSLRKPRRYSRRLLPQSESG